MGGRAQPRRPDALSAAAVVLGAFLLFLIQPLAARALLPRFGGVPAVWAASLATYQVLLFLGYLGAHLVRTRLRPRTQGMVLVASVLGALTTLPILPASAGEGGGAAAVALVLAGAVGPAFFVLAMGGSLAQAWSPAAGRGRGVYVLYAVSNAASLAALLGYPLVLERLWGMTRLGWIWSGLFVVQAGLLIALARRRAYVTDEPAAEGAALPPGPTLRAGAWAAVGVMILNGVTTWLGQDVASVPLLWVVPLALYLGTWIAAFSGRWTPGVQTTTAFAGAAAAALAVAFASETEVGRRIGLALVALVLACLAAHGTLHRERPEGRRLTGFYLALAGGGAVGGLVSGVAAPLLGAAWTELQLGFGGLALLAAWTRWGQAGPAVSPRIAAAVSSLLVCVLAGVVILSAGAPRDGQLLAHRDFHGLLRVVESHADDPARHRLTLLHGATQHGAYALGPEAPAATTYFGPTTGCGLAVAARRDRVGEGRGLNIGVVGLGAGTVAVYGRPGDALRFYELSPAVTELAWGDDDLPGGGFGYLRDSRAEISVVDGDARLSLARELAAEPRGRGYDLMILDAFAGDAVPVHLLTREFFALLDRHLAPDALVAVHVSSNWIDLRPVLYAWAAAEDRRALTIANRSRDGDAVLISTWVLLFRDLETLRALRDVCSPLMSAGAIQVENRNDVDWGGLPVWTDDRSDLISLLRARIRAR